MRSLPCAFAAALPLWVLAACGPVEVPLEVVVPPDTPEAATVLAVGADPAFGPSGLALARGADGRYRGKVLVQPGAKVHFQLRLRRPDAPEVDLAFQPVEGHELAAGSRVPPVPLTVAHWDYPFDPAHPTVTITVHPPAGTPDAPLYLAGSFPGVEPVTPKGVELGKLAGGSFRTKLYPPPGSSGLLLVTQGSWTAAEYSTAAHDWPWHPIAVRSGALNVDIPVAGWLPATGKVLTGDIHYLYGVHSDYLGNNRDVIIWLPQSYAAEPARRFPVLYMHDGQNLMDYTTSFAGEWHADETAQRLVKLGLMEPTIIVGVFNTGSNRIPEYTQVADPQHPEYAGGRGDLYGRFLAEELKPKIDAAYRTLPDPAHTGLAGSSLGGLISMYFGISRTEFQRLGVVSPSIWWANRDIVTRVNALPEKLPLRIWEDIGTAEGSSATSETVDDARLLRDALLSKDWVLGQDLQYEEVLGAGHNEKAWAARLDQIFMYLYPPQ